jgi:hypothetical protein
MRRLAAAERRSKRVEKSVPLVGKQVGGNVRDLKDKNFRLVGRIKTGRDGRETLTRPDGRALGQYDPKTDRTTRPSGSFVGKGNWLSRLLEK